MRPTQYCANSCPTCPLGEIMEQPSRQPEDWLGATVTGVFRTFSQEDVLEADARSRDTADARTVEDLIGTTSFMSSIRTRELSENEEQLVGSAIVKIAKGECNNYFPERRF